MIADDRRITGITDALGSLTVANDRYQILTRVSIKSRKFTLQWAPVQFMALLWANGC